MVGLRALDVFLTHWRIGLGDLVIFLVGFRIAVRAMFASVCGVKRPIVFIDEDGRFYESNWVRDGEGSPTRLVLSMPF